MKRRWWPWGIAAVVAGGLLAGVLLIAPAAPYDFLEGHREIRVPIPKAHMSSLKKAGLEYSFYSFRTDFEALRRQADRELKKKGFAPQFDVPAGKASLTVAYYSRGDMSWTPRGKAAPTPRATRDFSNIMLYKDMRYGSHVWKPGFKPGKDKGWVMVMIMAPVQKTPFDSVRNWIGL
jgi:hypothetical protein